MPRLSRPPVAPGTIAGVDDPFRLFLVVRRNALTTLARGGARARAAAGSGVRPVDGEEPVAAGMAAGRPRPGSGASCSPTSRTS